jgi:hypothetical protein
MTICTTGVIPHRQSPICVWSNCLRPYIVSIVMGSHTVTSSHWIRPWILGLGYVSASIYSITSVDRSSGEVDWLWKLKTRQSTDHPLALSRQKHCYTMLYTVRDIFTCGLLQHKPADTRSFCVLAFLYELFLYNVPSQMRTAPWKPKSNFKIKGYSLSISLWVKMSVLWSSTDASVFSCSKRKSGQSMMCGCIRGIKAGSL